MFYGWLCSAPRRRPVLPGNLAEMVVMEGGTRARHVPPGNTRDQVLTKYDKDTYIT